MFPLTRTIYRVVVQKRRDGSILEGFISCDGLSDLQPVMDTASCDGECVGYASTLDTFIVKEIA